MEIVAFIFGGLLLLFAAHCIIRSERKQAQREAAKTADAAMRPIWEETDRALATIMARQWQANFEKMRQLRIKGRTLKYTKDPRRKAARSTLSAHRQMPIVL